MTLPTEYYFPPFDRQHVADKDNNVDPQKLTEYMKELVTSLENMYTELALGANGQQKRDTSPPSQSWVPSLAGSTTAGSFTYFSRTGLAQRIGVMTDVFFDIRWTASSGATGNLYIELPYLVTKSTLMPFVGPIQSSTISYGTATYLTCNAIPNTRRLEIWKSQSGTTMAAIDAAVATAGRVAGSIRYIGQQDA